MLMNMYTVFHAMFYIYLMMTLSIYLQSFIDIEFFILKKF